jgi:hypothetical protein
MRLQSPSRAEALVATWARDQPWPPPPLERRCGPSIFSLFAPGHHSDSCVPLSSDGGHGFAQAVFDPTDVCAEPKQLRYLVAPGGVEKGVLHLAPGANVVAVNSDPTRPHLLQVTTPSRDLLCFTESEAGREDLLYALSTAIQHDSPAATHAAWRDRFGEPPAADNLDSTLAVGHSVVARVQEAGSVASELSSSPLGSVVTSVCDVVAVTVAGEGGSAGPGVGDFVINLAEDTLTTLLHLSSSFPLVKVISTVVSGVFQLYKVLDACASAPDRLFAPYSADLTTCLRCSRP